MRHLLLEDFMKFVQHTTNIKLKFKLSLCQIRYLNFEIFAAICKFEDQLYSDKYGYIGIQYGIDSLILW